MSIRKTTTRKCELCYKMVFGVYWK